MLEPLINLANRNKTEGKVVDEVNGVLNDGTNIDTKIDNFEEVARKYSRVGRVTREQTQNPERIFKFTVAKLLREEPYIKEAIQQILNLSGVGDQVRSELSAENLELFLKNIGPKKKEGSSNNQTEKQRVAESVTVYRPLIAAIMRVPRAKELFLKAIGWRDEQRSNELKTYIRKENKEGRIPFANIVIIGGGSQANVIATDLQRLVGNDITVVVIDGGNGRGSIDGAIRMNSAARKPTDDDNPRPGFGGDINPGSDGAMLNVADLTSDYYASGFDKGNETQINGVFSAAFKILNEYVNLKDVTFDADGMTINFGAKEDSQKIKSELMVVAGGLGNPNEYPFDPIDDETDAKTKEIFERERAKGKNSRILTYRERLQEGLDPENFAPNRKYVDARVGIGGRGDTSFVLIEGLVGKNEGTQKTLDANQFGRPKKIIVTTPYKSRKDLIAPGIAIRPRYNTLCDVFPKEEGDDTRLVDPVDGRLIGLVDPPVGKDVLVGLYQLADGTRITKELDFLFLATGQDKTERANFIEEQVGGFTILNTELERDGEFQKLCKKIKNEGPESLIGATFTFKNDSKETITSITKNAQGKFLASVEAYQEQDDGTKLFFNTEEPIELEDYIVLLQININNKQLKSINFDRTNPIVPEIFLEEITDEETGEIVAKQIKGTDIILAGVYANIRLTDEEKKKAREAFDIDKGTQVVALWRTIRKSMILTRQYLAGRRFKRGQSDLKLNNDAYELPITDENNFVQEFRQTLSPEIKAYKGELELDIENAFKLRLAGLLHNVRWPEASGDDDNDSFSLFITRINDGDTFRNKDGINEKGTKNDKKLDELNCNVAATTELRGITAIIRDKVLADVNIQKYLGLLAKKRKVKVKIPIVRGEQGIDLRKLLIEEIFEKPSKPKVLKVTREDFATRGKMVLPSDGVDSEGQDTQVQPDKGITGVEVFKTFDRIKVAIGTKYIVNSTQFFISETELNRASSNQFIYPEVRTKFDGQFLVYFDRNKEWKIRNDLPDKYKEFKILNIKSSAVQSESTFTQIGDISDGTVIKFSDDLYVQFDVSSDNKIAVTFLDKSPLENAQENQNKESNIKRIIQLEVGKIYDVRDRVFIIGNREEANNETEQLILTNIETDSPILFNFIEMTKGWAVQNVSKLSYTLSDPASVLEEEIGYLQSSDLKNGDVIAINQKLFLQFIINSEKKISVKVLDRYPGEDEVKEVFEGVKNTDIVVGKTYAISGSKFTISNPDAVRLAPENLLVPETIKDLSLLFTRKDTWFVKNPVIDTPRSLRNANYTSRISNVEEQQVINKDVIRLSNTLFAQINIDSNNNLSVTFLDSNPFDTRQPEDDYEGFNDDSKKIDIELGKTYAVNGNNFNILTSDADQDVYTDEEYILPPELGTVRFPVFIDGKGEKRKWRIGNANAGTYDIKNNGKIETIENASLRDISDNDVLKIAENYYVRFNIDSNNKISVTFFSEDPTKGSKEEAEQIPEENTNFYSRSFEVTGNAELSSEFGFADFNARGGVNLPSLLKEKLKTNIYFSRQRGSLLDIRLLSGSNTKIAYTTIDGIRQEYELRFGNSEVRVDANNVPSLIQLTDDTSLLLTYNSSNNTYVYKFINQPYENLKDRDFIALSNGAEEKIPDTTETEEEVFPEFELNKKFIFKKTFIIGEITTANTLIKRFEIPDKYNNIPNIKILKLEDYWLAEYQSPNPVLELDRVSEIELGDDLFAKVEIVNGDLQLEFVEKAAEEEKKFFETTSTFKNSFYIGENINSLSARQILEIPSTYKELFSNGNGLVVRRNSPINPEYWTLQKQNSEEFKFLVSYDSTEDSTNQITILEGFPVQIQISETLTLLVSVQDGAESISVQPFNGPLNPAYFS